MIKFIEVTTISNDIVFINPNNILYIKQIGKDFKILFNNNENIAVNEENAKKLSQEIAIKGWDGKIQSFTMSNQ